MSEVEEVEELTPEMTGRYLVYTQGSIHLWDLDKGYYVRNPGPESKGRVSEDLNHTELRWKEVRRWPKVGDVFAVVLTQARWHRSSIIRKIERV